MNKPTNKEVVDSLMRAVDKYPVDQVLECGLTLMGKLGANMREARIISDCALMLAFTDAMHIVFEQSDTPTPQIKLFHEKETLQ